MKAQSNRKSCCRQKANDILDKEYLHYYLAVREFFAELLAKEGKHIHVIFSLFFLQQYLEIASALLNKICFVE